MNLRPLSKCGNGGCGVISLWQARGTSGGDHLGLALGLAMWGHPAVGTASPQLGLGAEQNAAGPVLPDLPSWEENLQTGFYVKYLDF